ncbi:hypothetical protein BKA64DRAFT_711634 [Cadophora sp. MPI-SDFR-AT-0126]|nr:hypothetical protein BKA64DRAFT_711634 [Leotiomycetes sp. MPI-SDFR-AT-0126]
MVSLSKLQLGTINGAFKTAFEEGRDFATVEAVGDYLKEAGISGDLIDPHMKELFGCYLVQSKEFKHRQLPTPSSSPKSQTSGLEREDGSEQAHQSDQTREAIPSFISQDTQFISTFRPHNNDWDLLVARKCEGDTTYVSETIVSQYLLGTRCSHILLRWRYTGADQRKHFFRTRCEVIKAEQLPDCDIAFGENFGTDDEESQGAKDRFDDSNSHQSDDSVYQGSEGIIPHGRSPEEGALEEMLTRIGTNVAAGVVTRTTFQITEALLGLKRRGPLFDASDMQSKRVRRG